MRFDFRAVANFSIQLSSMPSTSGGKRAVVRNLGETKAKHTMLCSRDNVGLKSEAILCRLFLKSLLLFSCIWCSSAWAFCLEVSQWQSPHTGLSSMFCIHWFKSVKWKKSWPYRPPVSDDDEGITAVEAAGGESVQLQRVHCAVVLTFCKQPEGWKANVGLLQDSIRLRCHHILNSRGIIRVFSCEIITNTCK